MSDRYPHVFATPTHCTHCGSRPDDDDAPGECPVRLRQALETAQDRVVDLERRYCTHNVAAILTADGNNRLRGGR